MKQYSVPSRVAPHIDYISGIHHFPKGKDPVKQSYYYLSFGLIQFMQSL